MLADLMTKSSKGIYVYNISKKDYDEVIDNFLNLGYGVDATEWFEDSRILIDFSRKDVSVHDSRPPMIDGYYELDMRA